jgi:hypothetical protein
MNFLNLFQKDKVGKEITSVQSIDQNGNIVQMVEAEVIKVGPEVTDEEIDEELIEKRKQQEEKLKKKKNYKPKYNPVRFSYKYKFTDPITGKEVTAFDDLITVEVGEQIYDVGEKLYVLYSNTPNKESGQDFTVMRKLVFPETINRKKKFKKIIKIIYYVILVLLISICTCANLSKQQMTNENETQENTELTQEEVEELLEK